MLRSTLVRLGAFCNGESMTQDHNCYAGLGMTAPAVKDNVHTLKLTFEDHRRILSRHHGGTLQLTGACPRLPNGEDFVRLAACTAYLRNG